MLYAATSSHEIFLSVWQHNKLQGNESHGFSVETHHVCVRRYTMCPIYGDNIGVSA